MTPARQTVGQVFAEWKSRDGDHEDVLRQLELKIQRATRAI